MAVAGCRSAPLRGAAGRFARNRGFSIENPVHTGFPSEARNRGLAPPVRRAPPARARARRSVWVDFFEFFRGLSEKVDAKIGVR